MRKKFIFVTGGVLSALGKGLSFLQFRGETRLFNTRLFVHKLPNQQNCDRNDRGKQKIFLFHDVIWAASGFG